MPKSSEEIVKTADQWADFFETEFRPDVSNELAALRSAARHRAEAERETADAVVAAHETGVPWRVIGETLGTSGEAARQRYSRLCQVETKTKGRSRSEAGAANRAVADRAKAGVAHKI